MKQVLQSEDRGPKTEGKLKSEARTASVRHGVFRIPTLSIAGLLAIGTRAPVVSVPWLLAIGYWLSVPSAAEPNPPTPTSAPFLRLRESTLGYHGPSADLTNLTEIRLGWFGPTNLNDPLTGDLWWTANRAVQDANDQLAPRSETRNPESEGRANPESRNPTHRSSPNDPISPSADRTPASGVRPSDFGLLSDFGPRISDFHRLPFRLIPRWSVDPWGTGVSQLTRMVYDEQPLALLGSVDSASTHLAEQIVAKANLPLVSPITTDKSVTLAGVSWMFSCAPSDDAIARVLVDEILATLAAIGAGESAIRMGPSTSTPSADSAFRVPPSALPRGLAMLTCTDHESRMTAREVLREFSRRGRMPDFRFEAPPGLADLDRQMEALAETRPAIVLIVAGAGDAARWVKAIREMTPSARAFGTHTFGRARFRELAGAAAEGVRFPLLFTADPGDPRYSRFASRFQAERGRAPDYTAVLTYDATRLLIEAIRQAGPNRARIRETLAQLSPWSGLAGPIQFDGTGQNTRTNICLGTIRDGAIVTLPCFAGSSYRRTSNPAKP